MTKNELIEKILQEVTIEEIFALIGEQTSSSRREIIRVLFELLDAISQDRKKH